ncbi:MAG: OPT family oligopeptide transporter, partial [Planctomycetota bacterium]
LIAAILGFSLFAALRQNLSVLECNITQTTGSAAGCMASAAGLLAPIPALSMMGHEIPVPALFLWALSVAYLGVMFAVPLRRQMVEVDKLRFPTGTATAQTIMAMFAEASEAVVKAKVLLFVGLGAGAFTLAIYFVPQIERPLAQLGIAAMVATEALDFALYGRVLVGTGVAAMTVAAAWGFTVYLGPMLFGAGILVGPRVGISLLLGAIVAWGITGPLVQKAGWAPGAVMAFADGPRGWLLWPGVAIMVSEALTALALSWRTFVRALRGTAAAGRAGAERGGQAIPNSWWMGGLLVASTGTVLVAWFAFEIPLYMTVIAIAMSSMLAVVAVRSTGETDINPVGGMGKVTQLVFGGVSPGNMVTNLMAAGITGAGASQAGDIMHDLKSGKLLGAAPRKQFIAQLVGIGAGVCFCVPAFLLVTSAYEIGGDELPAPAAHAWRAMAEVLARGFEALPPHAVPAVLLGMVFGAMLPVLRRIKPLAPYVPSGLAFGIAFIVQAYFSIIIFVGAMALVLWRMRSSVSAKRLSFAVASGLVAGEGLFGVLKAAMTLIGVPTLTGGH